LEGGVKNIMREKRSAESGKKEYVCEFLQAIRKMNSGTDIVIIFDNFRSHHANNTREYAELNNMKLVYLPPYSPDLNPIEYIWKSIRRIISRTFMHDLDHLKQIIFDAFKKIWLLIEFCYIMDGKVSWE